jgi:catechol 2,3-dioxygenase-like lactoylglutathione lyase family enzyme
MMQLSIVSVPVSDQERSKTFYRDVLGFSVFNDTAMNETQRWVMMKPPSGPAAISLVTWFDAMPAGSLRGLVLDTGDIERAHQKLSSQGLQISAIETASWGRYATFSDPDGNGWALVTAYHG